MSRLKGTIRRRLLLNYRVPLEDLAPLLPAPFLPAELPGSRGDGMAGVCLIRLERIRPPGVPRCFGVASENAAHRIAVQWTQRDGALRDGVYIPRRDTGSRLNRWAGGRLVHTEHHAAAFDVRDDGQHVQLSMRSLDGQTAVDVCGHETDRWSSSSAFADVASASRFFASGCVGFSTGARGQLTGIRLATDAWAVRPFAVEGLRSTFFDGQGPLAPGVASFDCGLVMRDILHEWHAVHDVPGDGKDASPRS